MTINRDPREDAARGESQTRNGDDRGSDQHMRRRNTRKQPRDHRARTTNGAAETRQQTREDINWTPTKD